jgi:hypothetical protein
MDMDLTQFVREALMPDRYTQPTLDGHVDHVDEFLPGFLRAEAALLLSLADQDTYPDEVAWAAGVLLIRDAPMLLGPVAAAAAGQERRSGSLDGGRMYRADRHGVRITTPAGPVAEVSWTEVADLVPATAVPDELIDQIEALTDAQADLVRAMKAPDADADELAARELELEDLSRRLAARVWQACRPVDPTDVVAEFLANVVGPLAVPS